MRNLIAALAQACLDVAKDTHERLPMLEAELNALVYQAYSLDEDDIRVIEEGVGGRAHSNSATMYEADEDKV